MTKLLFTRFCIFALIAATGLFADLWTKAKLFSWDEVARPGSVYWLWDHHAGFQLSLNEGALFGMGQGGAFGFAIVSIIAAIAIPAWLFLFRAAQDRFLNAVLGMVMGGVLGNLYDRLGLHQLTWDRWDPSRAGERVYAVRDWILWQWNDEWRWPNFNIADALLLCGAIILMLHAWFEQRTVSNAEKESPTDTTAMLSSTD